MSILIWPVIGLIVGWLFNLIARDRGFVFVGNILIGIVGAMLGGLVTAEVFDLYDSLFGLNLTSIIAAGLGSIMTIWIIRRITRPVQSV